jgi:hypothetical protein
MKGSSELAKRALIPALVHRPRGVQGRGVYGHSIYLIGDAVEASVVVALRRVLLNRFNAQAFASPQR